MTGWMDGWMEGCKLSCKGKSGFGCGCLAKFTLRLHDTTFLSEACARVGGACEP